MGWDGSSDAGEAFLLPVSSPRPLTPLLSLWEKGLGDEGTKYNALLL